MPNLWLPLMALLFISADVCSQPSSLRVSLVACKCLVYLEGPYKSLCPTVVAGCFCPPARYPLLAVGVQHSVANASRRQPPPKPQQQPTPPSPQSPIRPPGDRLLPTDSRFGRCDSRFSHRPGRFGCSGRRSHVTAGGGFDGWQRLARCGRAGRVWRPRIACHGKQMQGSRGTRGGGCRTGSAWG